MAAFIGNPKRGGLEAVQPHRVERFKLSNDPQFEAKARDVPGLCRDSPDRALVLCVGREEPNPGARPDRANPPAASSAVNQNRPSVVTSKLNAATTIGSRTIRGQR